MSKTPIKTTEPATDNFLIKMKEFYETKDGRRNDKLGLRQKKKR